MLQRQSTFARVNGGWKEQLCSLHPGQWAWYEQAPLSQGGCACCTNARGNLGSLGIGRNLHPQITPRALSSSQPNQHITSASNPELSPPLFLRVASRAPHVCFCGAAVGEAQANRSSPASKGVHIQELPVKAARPSCSTGRRKCARESRNSRR